MNCYFFGDSFTSGYRLTEYLLDCYPQQDIKHWTELLSEELVNKPAINYAAAGNCNEQILLSLVDNYEKFEPKDFVIIGLSSPIRQLVFSDTSIIPIKPYINKTLDQTIKELSEQHPNMDPVVIKKTIEYQTFVKGPQSDLYNGYYIKEYNFIAELLRKQGINVLIWDYSLWECFETISLATNYKCEDKHWSYKGSTDFYNFVYLNFNSRFLSKESFVEYVLKTK